MVYLLKNFTRFIVEKDLNMCSYSYCVDTYLLSNEHFSLWVNSTVLEVYIIDS